MPSEGLNAGVAWPLSERLDQKLAVHRVVHGAAQGEVAGHIIARIVFHIARQALRARGNHGKGNAARVDRLHRKQLIARGQSIGHGGGGVGHVHLACLGGGERGVFVHEHHHDALHHGRFAVVVGVRLENDLLAAIPLGQLVATGADGIAAVIVAVRMGGADAHRGKRVHKDVEGMHHADLDRLVVERHGLGHHGQIDLGRRGVFDAVDGEGHVFGGQRLAVGELDVGADLERPHHAVLAAFVGRCQVVMQAHVGVGLDQRRLDERLVHVLAAAPCDERVEARLGLGVRGHGHDHLLGRTLLFGGGIGLGCRFARRARGQNACEGRRGATRSQDLRKTTTRHEHGFLHGGPLPGRTRSEAPRRSASGPSPHPRRGRPLRRIL